MDFSSSCQEPNENLSVVLPNPNRLRSGALKNISLELSCSLSKSIVFLWPAASFSLSFHLHHSFSLASFYFLMIFLWPSFRNSFLKEQVNQIDNHRSVCIHSSRFFFAFWPSSYTLFFPPLLACVTFRRFRVWNEALTTKRLLFFCLHSIKHRKAFWGIYFYKCYSP